MMAPINLLLFARNHATQIIATAVIVAYSLRRNKLTIGGVSVGILVATIHMMHPWPGFFWLLFIFFTTGTLVTKIGHSQKAHLTLSSTGGSGGEGARSASQVLANTGFACVLIATHTYILRRDSSSAQHFHRNPDEVISSYYFLENVLPIGVVAQYSAVASDTFSSELGILSKGTPFLITQPRKRVPRGTNGGVTLWGLLCGVMGSVIFTVSAALLFRLNPPYTTFSVNALFLITQGGIVGTIIDSIFGALLQETVTDRKSGKVVEGPGGVRVKVSEGGSRTRSGRDLLTNNGVNFAMASSVGTLAMVVAWMFDIR